MLVCDRCRKNPARYNKFLGKYSSVDLCTNCYKDFEKLNEVFEDIEELFLTNVNVKIKYRSEDK